MGLSVHLSRGWLRLGALALGAILIAAACGSTSTAAKSTLTQVIERGTLRIAIIVPNSGFAVADPSGNLIGYEADIANLLAQQMGVKIEWIQTDAPGRVTLVQTGKADLAIATFTRNLERMKVISFTDPILQEAVVLVTTPEHTQNTVADFNTAGLKISVLTGGTQVEATKAVLPLAEVLSFPSGDDALQALLSGQVDAATVGNVAVGQLIETYPGRIKAVEGSLTPPQDDGIGLPFGDFAWWNYVNTFVHNINADGTTWTLWQKYFAKGTSPCTCSVPPPGQ